MGQPTIQIPDWQSAIDTVYAVFSRYPRPTILAASPVKDEKDVQDMLADMTSAPLRQLSCNRLSTFELSSVYTVGAVEDYKHFLPRILELMMPQQGAFYFRAEQIARKLRFADFDTWPGNEVSAVHALFRAAVQPALFIEPPNAQLVELLVANVGFGTAPDRLLSEVQGTADVNVIRNLAALVCEILGMPDRSSHLNHLDDADNKALDTWARSQGVIDTLYRGIDLVSTDHIQEVETALFGLGLA